MIHTTIEYHGEKTKAAFCEFLARMSKENLGKYIFGNTVFEDGWASVEDRFDRYVPGRQTSRWLGGYWLNGEFKKFTEKQIVWEQNQGLLCE